MPKEEDAGVKVDTRISELKKKAEAVLFAAGRTVAVEELSRLIKENSHELLKEAVKELKKELESKDSPLLLTEESNGNAWKLTVRDKYVEMVRAVSPHTELDKALLGTLAIIAWKHPISQAELVKIRSTVAYEHVAKLLELGFITREKTGRTFVIKVTGKFFEYFDLPDQEAIKKVFGEITSAAEKKEKEPAENTAVDAAENVVVYKAKGVIEDKKESTKKNVVAELETEHLGNLDVYESEEKEEEAEETKKGKQRKEDEEGIEKETEDEDAGEEEINEEETAEEEEEPEKENKITEDKDTENIEEKAETGHEETEEQDQNQEEAPEEEPEQKNNQKAKAKEKEQKEQKRRLSKELEDFAGEEEYIGKEEKKKMY